MKKKSNFLGKKVGEAVAEKGRQKDGKSEDEVQFPAKIVCRALLLLHSSATPSKSLFGKKKIRKQPVIPFYYNMELLFLSFFVSLFC